MLEQGAFLRVQEGAFVFLLPADQTLSIEGRQREVFELVGGADSILCAHYIAGGARVPVIRLAALLGVTAGEWGYAILIDGDSGRVAFAAEHIDTAVDRDKLAVQPFNPAGVAVHGEPLITGVCPDTEPEHLVLEPARLQRCLRHAAAREGGR